MKPSGKITHHWQLEVYQLAMEAAMDLFHLSKEFPPEEMYSITDQVRRSSRSVASHISEAWRRRRYVAAFCDKLNGSESEAGETQTWIEFAVRCGYFTARQGRELHRIYDQIMGKLVTMQNNPEVWLLKNPRTRP
ncbi:MAG TPA: four helix bundle protein [Verrucomicrobiae bacterium]|nr:four helix bundle protein [Verrucomicrobiae bacterium]